MASPLKESFNFFVMSEAVMTRYNFVNQLECFTVFIFLVYVYCLFALVKKLCENRFIFSQFNWALRKQISFTSRHFWQPTWFKTNMRAFPKKLQRANNVYLFIYLFINVCLFSVEICKVCDEQYRKENFQSLLWNSIFS